MDDDAGVRNRAAIIDLGVDESTPRFYRIAASL
jgi:hypothetical protein